MLLPFAVLKSNDSFGSLVTRWPGVNRMGKIFVIRVIAHTG